MTYNEWRDELKNNLLSVSESERQKVLDYYAEAYADRREAGFSEREIIADFGAPYDAAQRILCDRSDYSDDPFNGEKRERESKARPRQEEERPRGDNSNTDSPEDEIKSDDSDSIRNNRLLFVLLCLVFAAPLFGIFMGMVGVSIGFCVAPFAVLFSGIGIAGGGIGAMVGGQIFTGLAAFGLGLIVVGVGVILTSVFTKILKFIWKLWSDLFKWLKSLFGIKEKEKAK